MECGGGAYAPDRCPPSRALELLADKWKVVVVCALEDRPRRTGELRRGIEGISQKVLTETLRGLERDGLVQRTLFPGVPPAVEYGLTPLGQSLLCPVAALHRWAQTHLPEVEAARQGAEPAPRAAVPNGPPSHD